jgi:tryptophan 2,3-dioxygenase
MSVLETMPTEEFQRFRDALGTASGLESDQFRRLERLASALPSQRGITPAGHAERSASSSVRQAFLRSLAGHIPPLPEQLRDRDAPIWGDELAERLAEPRLLPHRSLALAMLAVDRQFMHWRRQHFELAHRMIGDSAGTGGSTGATYLRATMERRFFPELWSWAPAEADASE